MSILLRNSTRIVCLDFSVVCAPTGGVVSLMSNRRTNGKRFLSLSNVTSTAAMSPSPNVSPPSSTEINMEKLGNQTDQLINVTEKCRKRLNEILDEKGSFLRVAVEGGGCSGFQYKFEVDNQTASEDIVICKDTSSSGESPLVVIDAVSLDLIKGSTLDYETELIRSSFRVVNNPHAEQGCSCGASFNMKL